MRQIILASQSPRRKELLSKMGVRFKVIPSSYEEKLDNSRSAEEVAKELALGKALSIAEQYPEDIIIAADTIVTIDGEQLGKPSDNNEAHAMLKKLAGKAHKVTTGVALMLLSEKKQFAGSDTTIVHFHPYDEHLVIQYISTGDPLDKAGGYGLQSGAAPLIKSVEGRLDNAIGLPTNLVAHFLEQLHIACRPVVLKSPL